MTRLAIFTTHPIQYQAPWFRALAVADGLDVEVVFSYVPDATQQGVGFGTAFEWDIPLLTGYQYRVLTATLLPRPVPGFARRWAGGIGRALDEIRPDVAMVLGWQEISLVQALIACRRGSIPVILRGESNALRSRPGLVSMLHRKYFAMCDSFLAIGQANADLYRAAGVPESRIVTARYFVDNDRFSDVARGLTTGRSTIRGGWSIAEDAVCFAFVGKLEPKKCVMHFLEALRLARDRGALIAGLIVGSGAKLEEARHLVATHSLPVTFAGFLNQSEVPSAYLAADALVLPSNYGETWGLVVNEAMASGIPAIVSDRVGCAHDLVLDGETGFVIPFGDVEVLARRIEYLARNEGKLRSLGKAAKTHVAAAESLRTTVVARRCNFESCFNLHQGLVCRSIVAKHPSERLALLGRQIAKLLFQTVPKVPKVP